MENKQKSIELSNLGIAEKRKGNYDKALSYYEEAKNACKANQDVYYNISKILIGLGEYSEGFKNLMTYSHINLLNSDTSYFSNNIMETPIWDNAIELYSYQNEIIKGLSGRDIDLYYNYAPFYSMILDHNACFLAGLCYLLSDEELIKHHKIRPELIEGIKNGLLGRIGNMDLKQGDYSKLINLLGLCFMILNFIPLYGENQKKVTEIYLSDKIEINRNLVEIFKN